MSLKSLFYPSSIAVIGVSREEHKVGHLIFDNIRNSGFKGPFFPVNPKADEIHAIKCYPSILDIPVDVEMAVIVVPAKFVPKVMEECGKKGVKATVIISAGFKEAGIEGSRLEKEVASIAKSNGIRIVGPNCLGIINTDSPYNASFTTHTPKKGNISFFSQSGALCAAILDWSIEEKIGFHKFVSLGNKADLTEVDFLEDFLKDPKTKVITGYLEGVTEGEKFIKVTSEVSKKKPVILVKSGGTDSGAKAISSHTGTLAGSQAAYDAAFKQSGVIHAQSVQDLFDYSVALAYQPLPLGRRAAIVTNAGGAGVMASDACERNGIILSQFSSETIDRLRSFLPSAANVYNPVDVLGDSLAERYLRAANLLINDENVNSLIAILVPAAPTQIKETAIGLAELSKRTEKTIIACFMGKDHVKAGIEILIDNSIPNYHFPERAIASLAAMNRYRKYVVSPEKIYQKFDVDREKVQKIFATAIFEDKRFLSDEEAREVVKAYGIRIPKTELAKDINQAIEIAERIGYPLVLKVASPDILHKTDVGGVKIGIKNKQELRDSFDDIIWEAKRYMPNAKILGVILQEFISAKREVILGMNKDPQFGPLLMFGLGGIYVEALKDVSFRVAPITESEAWEMISEIKSFPLLRGIRGEKSADIDSIVDSLLRLSQLVTDFPNILEMDINPLMVYDKGKRSVATDVRISLGG